MAIDILSIPLDDRRQARTGYVRALPLTPRQLEVLALAAAGETAADIARRLWVSVDTIKTHRKNIISALGARNIVHAVAIAYQRGLW